MDSDNQVVTFLSLNADGPIVATKRARAPLACCWISAAVARCVFGVSVATKDLRAEQAFVSGRQRYAMASLRPSSALRSGLQIAVHLLGRLCCSAACPCRARFHLPTTIRSRRVARFTASLGRVDVPMIRRIDDTRLFIYTASQTDPDRHISRHTVVSFGRRASTYENNLGAAS